MFYSFRPSLSLIISIPTIDFDPVLIHIDGISRSYASQRSMPNQARALILNNATSNSSSLSSVSRSIKDAGPERNMLKKNLRILIPCSPASKKRVMCCISGDGAASFSVAPKYVKVIPTEKMSECLITMAVEGFSKQPAELIIS